MTGVLYYTPTEIAARLRVSKMTVYRLISDGTLPAVKVGRSYRVNKLDYVRFIDDNKAGAA